MPGYSSKDDDAHSNGENTQNLKKSELVCSVGFVGGRDGGGTYSKSDYFSVLVYNQ